MRSIWKGVALVMFLGLLLSGCGAPQWLFPGPTETPVAVAIPTPLPTGTDTPPAPGSCAYVWSSRSLPDVTSQLNQAFRTSGLAEAEAEATAYGEDCFDSETNQVVQFLAMQTDFFVRVQVDRIDDPQALGEWVEKIMRVLKDFSPGQVPGPNPGYVGMTFTAGSETANLWFRRSDADQLLQQGLRGSSLYDALQKP